jgi:hypothetical protein
VIILFVCLLLLLLLLLLFFPFCFALYTYLQFCALSLVQLPSFLPSYFATIRVVVVVFFFCSLMMIKLLLDDNSFLQLRFFLSQVTSCIQSFFFPVSCFLVSFLKLLCVCVCACVCYPLCLWQIGAVREQLCSGR